MSNFTALKKFTLKSKKEVLQIIPNNWEYVYGRDVYKPVSGISSSKLNYEEDELLYLKVSDMNDPQNQIWIDKSVITCSVKNSQINNIITKNSIIFPKRGAAIFTNKVGILKRKGTLDPNLMALIPNAERIHYKYLYYYIKYFQLSNICENAGIPQLNNKDLNPLPIILPPLYEQQKISSILSNLDKIRIKTQKTIDQMRLLKTGLMQRLFSQGIGHTEFKETKLGRIPKEWKIRKIKDLIQYEKGKKPKYSIENYKNGYLPYLSAEYLRNGAITVYIEPSSKVVHSDYDNFILIWDGSNAGSFFVGQKGIISSTMVKINIKNNKIVKDFLYYACKFREREIKRQTRGTGIPHVDKLVFQNLKIPIPKIIEQNEIASILRNIDKEIINEKNYLKKLKKIKKGLMQVLLTGKRRVNMEN